MRTACWRPSSPRRSRPPRVPPHDRRSRPRRAPTSTAIAAACWLHVDADPGRLRRSGGHPLRRDAGRRARRPRGAGRPAHRRAGRRRDGRRRRLIGDLAALARPARVSSPDAGRSRGRIGLEFDRAARSRSAPTAIAEICGPPRGLIFTEPLLAAQDRPLAGVAGRAVTVLYHLYPTAAGALLPRRHPALTAPRSSPSRQRQHPTPPAPPTRRVTVRLRAAVGKWRPEGDGGPAPVEASSASRARS